MRAALFAPVQADESERIGHLTESAIFSQWQHSPNFRQLRYSRWRNEGEVDIVYLSGPRQLPVWVGEIKWSDRIAKHQHDETKAMQVLLHKHQSITAAFFTSRTITKQFTLEGKQINVWPSALYCYMVGRNITIGLNAPISPEVDKATVKAPVKPPTKAA